jgi:hypothetical protein
MDEWTRSARSAKCWAIGAACSRFIEALPRRGYRFLIADGLAPIALADAEAQVEGSAALVGALCRAVTGQHNVT